MFYKIRISLVAKYYLNDTDKFFADKKLCS